VGFDDPVDAASRVGALQEMRQEPDFQALASSFKRVMNILAQAETPAGPPDPSLMSDAEESALWQRYLEVSPGVQAAGCNHRYDDALRLMASLRGAVDAFFNKVLVMAEDPAVRRNRLALLNQLARLFLSLADISQMVVERVS
jgi:glycyl-tRNA synthetase beta chain